MPSYRIAGIKAGVGPGVQVPIRREIDEWWASPAKNDENQRSLFIRALREFESMDLKEDKSYFGISATKGVGWSDKILEHFFLMADDGFVSLILFAQYLLLFEQRLYEIMLQLIEKNTYAPEDRAEMEKAAQTWRLPYWDWAMKKPDWRISNPNSSLGPSVPYIITQPRVSVKGKNGYDNLDNPLWRFSLPESAGTFEAFGIMARPIRVQGKVELEFLHFEQCKATIKHPTTWQKSDPSFQKSWVNGEVQSWQTIIGELRGKPGSPNTLPEIVYRLFNDQIDYNTFAMDQWDSGVRPKGFISLEGIHNNLHTYSGGYGQMGSVPVAAFDPIFWLHHCNVDRLLAIYQALYPKKWITPFRNSLGKEVDENTDLAPFSLDDKSSFYKSSSCRDPQALYYTYPELQKWLDSYKVNGQFSEATYQASIRQTITKLYSTSALKALELPKNETVAGVHLSSLNAQNLRIEHISPTLEEKAVALMSPLAKSVTAHQTPPALPEGLESWTDNDYIVKVLYNKFALDGVPYMIRVFLGDVPPGPPFYFTDTPTQIGLVYTFSNDEQGRGFDETGCENCGQRREARVLSTGQIILTDHLIEHIKRHTVERNLRLDNLSREEVVDYLRTNLHWRVSDIYDRPILKENVADLKVSVAMGRATHYRDASRFSQYENYETLYEVTENRLAGANSGDLGDA